MIIRQAVESDWKKIQQIFAAEFNDHAPRFDSCTIVIAEEDGMIVGMATLQPLVHLEPLWVKHSHRGRYIWPRLIEKLREIHPTVNSVFSHTENSRLGKVMERLGMLRWPGSTYRWIRRD